MLRKTKAILGERRKCNEIIRIVVLVHRLCATNDTGRIRSTAKLNGIP
jgi:hypothetical protein